MAGLRALSKRLKTYTPEKVAKDLTAIIQSKESAAIVLNHLQLFKGQTSKGNFLPKYSKASVAKGKRPGPWQLYDEGDFYSGFFMRVSNDKLIFGSTDGKTETILLKLYNRGARNPDEIFGLTEENLDKFFKNTLIPAYREYFSKLLEI